MASISHHRFIAGDGSACQVGGELIDVQPHAGFKVIALACVERDRERDSGSERRKAHRWRNRHLGVVLGGHNRQLAASQAIA
jgi:hypothetical protein